MKKVFFVTAFLVTIFFAACDKSDDASTANITATAVNNTISTGTWKVTYFWDTDHEETANFNGFTFTFAGGSVVTATNTLFTVTGTWVVTTDGSKVKLVLNFPTSSLPEFADISEDWQVTERTDTRIKLQHVSGGGGGTDYLTFERI